MISCCFPKIDLWLSKTHRGRTRRTRTFCPGRVPSDLSHSEHQQAGGGHLSRSATCSVR